MIRKNTPRRAVAGLLLAAIVALGSAAPARAHCDTADGPVAVDVGAALAAGDVAGVLKWVTADDEAEVRRLFGQAVRVREAGGDAAAMADRLFLETVVRLHRQSEGEPYTGVKPAGTPSPRAVEAVDAALADGTADALVAELQAKLDAAVRRRYAQARDAAAHSSHGVEAGRAAVHAYVELVHFVKPLHDMLDDDPSAHAGGHDPAPAAQKHTH